MPAGQADRSTRSVASATQAPSRMPPSVSIAGYHASAELRVSTASLHAAHRRGNPKENPTPASRHAAAKPWVAPAESERISTCRLVRVIPAGVGSLRRQRRQRLHQDDDVVGGGVGAGVAGPQHPGQGLARRRCRGGPETPAAGESRTSSSRSAAAFSLLSEWSMTRVASMSMCSQPSRGRGGAGRPGRCPAPRSGGPHPGRCAASIRSSTSRHIVVVEAFAPEHMLAIAAQLPDPVDAVRAVGDRGRQIGEHLPGCMHPRAPVGVRQHRGDLRRQPGQVGQLAQHAHPGVRHHTMAVRRHFHPRYRPRYSSPAKCLPARTMEP